MRALLMLCAVLTWNTAANAQPVVANVQPFDRPASGIVLFTFGMDHPVRIGDVDASGALQVDVRAASAATIPDSVRKPSLGRLVDNLHFRCDDPSALGAPTDEVVARAENFYLHRDNMMAGALFAVSDTMLRPWIEDPGYQEPVAASFWDVIYTEQEMVVSASCTGTLMLENSNVPLAYSYDLKLVPGFNLVEYVIESIYKTDPDVMASKPSKVLVRTNTDASRIRWVAKHFM